MAHDSRDRLRPAAPKLIEPHAGLPCARTAADTVLPSLVPFAPAQG